MVVKVKEPQPSEYRYFRDGLILYTYLHLAAEPTLTRELAGRRVVAIAYETIQLDDGSRRQGCASRGCAGNSSRASRHFGRWGGGAQRSDGRHRNGRSSHGSRYPG